jgi:hypothetical protein
MFNVPTGTSRRHVKAGRGRYSRGRQRYRPTGRLVIRTGKSQDQEEMQKRIEAAVRENTLVDLKNIQDELAERDRKHRDIYTRENKRHLEGLETITRQVKQIGA